MDKRISKIFIIILLLLIHFQAFGQNIQKIKKLSSPVEFDGRPLFSTKISASVLIQYVRTEHNLITNFRFRYNPREGNDFYLVFNETQEAGSTNNVVPALPDYYDRTIMLKYTHTFQLKF
jgi:hypothetical protein